MSRFENEHSQPRDLDRLLLAYGEVCEVAPADILRAAIDRWEEAGGAEAGLRLSDDPAKNVEQETSEAARTSAQRSGNTEPASPARRAATRGR